MTWSAVPHVCAVFSRETKKKIIFTMRKSLLILLRIKMIFNGHTVVQCIYSNSFTVKIKRDSLERGFFQGGDADQELYAIFYLFIFVFLSLLSFLYISLYLPGVYFLNTCHHTFHLKSNIKIFDRI